ncbi:MAG TPA: tRNA dihydrouridine synthase DusB [Caldilineae bacterium]|nr:tRNA dihydrouridine synthase DusB [Caldilineae bacterium]
MTDEQRPQPRFWVRHIPVYGDLILAPMAGFSDLPYRSICRELGSAMSYTEFVSANTVIHQRALTDRALRRLRYKPEERPVVFQIAGADEDAIVEAAKRIEELEPDIIDLNLGCPARRVCAGGAGAALLRDPAKVARIFRKLTAALSVPVTGKIRLGWDAQSRNYLEVARAMEENGAALIAVHARTRDQDYSQPASWEAIAEIKQMVSVPVIGNGDAITVADIERMLVETGCDAVMVGRGAMGHPWIFQRIDRDQVPIEEKIAMIRRHLREMLAFYGEPLGLILMRKHIPCYLKGHYRIRRLRHSLLRCEDVETFHRLLDELAQTLK